MQSAIPWHEHVWPLADVKSWILSAVPGANHVGDPKVLSPKQWGQTAEFKIDEKSVVFKGCELSLFAKRTETEVLLSRRCPDYVPMLLAWKVLPNQQTWTLYRAFKGPDVEQTKKFENILEMTWTLAAIQTIVAQQSPAEKAVLPQTPVEQIPKMLDHMIERIANGYLDAWLANDSELLNAFALPGNVLEEIRSFRPQVAEWTQEYLDGKWPISIDHVDFNISNAVVQENGEMLIFDREEAVMSSPFFSIDRLLDDADAFEDDPASILHTEGHLRLTPNQMAIRNAYINAIPWHTRPQRERAFDWQCV